MLLAKTVPRGIYSWRLLVLINGRKNICTIRQQTYTELSKNMSYELL